MDDLRLNCPWDKKQTLDSLKRLTVEETYELNDAIENKNFENIKEELGDQWLSPDLFRFGASSLLGDIERQLEHYTTGVYSASYRHAMG